MPEHEFHDGFDNWILPEVIVLHIVYLLIEGLGFVGHLAEEFFVFFVNFDFTNLRVKVDDSRKMERQ